MKKFLFFISLVFNVLCCIAQPGDAEINALLAKYKRPVTVLEITTNESWHTHQLAPRYKGSFIVMVPGQEIAVQSSTHRRITVLNPLELGHQDINRLGLCEHLDVVIIPDIEQIAGASYTNTLNELLTLGDHIFIGAPLSQRDSIARQYPQLQEVASSATQAIYYAYTDKKELRLTRWTVHHTAQKKYSIISTFETKQLYKEVTDSTSTWVPGINLMTFVMLRGLYPTNSMIRKELKKLKDSEHNDLIIGNMVVQGTRIVPIDFGDRRRNANTRKCIEAACMVFRFNRRFKDPQEALQKYADYLHRSQRKKQ